MDDDIIKIELENGIVISCKKLTFGDLLLIKNRDNVDDIVRASIISICDPYNFKYELDELYEIYPAINNKIISHIYDDTYISAEITQISNSAKIKEKNIVELLYGFFDLFINKNYASKYSVKFIYNMIIIPIIKIMAYIDAQGKKR